MPFLVTLNFVYGMGSLCDLRRATLSWWILGQCGQRRQSLGVTQLLPVPFSCVLDARQILTCH